MDDPYLDEERPRPVRKAARHLLGSLWELGSTLVDYGKSQLVQLGNNVEQEIHRATQVLLWSALAAMLTGIGLLMAGITVVVAFWDSPYRLLVSILVTVTLFILAGISALVVRSKLRQRGTLLGGAAQAALMFSAYKRFLG